MKKLKVALIVVLLLIVAALTALYIYNNNIAVLNPKGFISVQQRELIIITSLLMLIVVVPVFILTFVITRKYRASNTKSKYDPNWGHSNLAEILWWGVPTVIIVLLAIVTWKTTHELNPFNPIETDKKPLKIQAVALNWKWLFIYPEQGVASINYVQFPAGIPLNFEITADAPMNSFWIPQLGGQIYAMPAMRTQLHLLANEPGTFRGSSANLSGKGFAGMVFTAKSTSEEEFNDWVEAVKRSSGQLDLNEYNQLVEPSEYNPVTTYVLRKSDLFDYIIMKYTPQQNTSK